MRRPPHSEASKPRPTLDVASRRSCLPSGTSTSWPQASSAPVCPQRAQDALRQIHIFDGPPEDQAYLAPDDDTTRSNVYTLKPIYDKGRFVTVRCEYRSSPLLDVRLPRVAKCVFRKGRQSYGNLRCG